MPAAPPLIDLDAAKREAQYPDGIAIVHTGTTFTLPSELPADCLTPLVELDLPSMLKAVLDARKDKEDDADDDESLGTVILDVLFGRPDLPKELLDAVHGIFRSLFGPEQYEVFEGNRPSINDYVRLAQALMPLYGIGLGEALGSAEPSESDGPTSSPTSDSTTASTPAASGSPRKKKGSSASAASAT